MRSGAVEVVSRCGRAVGGGCVVWFVVSWLQLLKWTKCRVGMGLKDCDLSGSVVCFG